jgi:lantibiotic biosynthesis protein
MSFIEREEHGQSSVHWQPLLQGEVATHARVVVLEIVEALEGLPSTEKPAFMGEASTALLFAYCRRSSALARLDAAMSCMSKQPLTISLFSGVSGVLWLLNSLTSDEESDSLIVHLHAALMRHLDVQRWEDRYDLASGLAGVGVYAAARGCDVAVQIAERVLSHLEATAMVDCHGSTWRTPARFLHAVRRARFPDGVVDLGVAHGQPGIVGMLAQFVDADIARERSRRLLQEATAWLLGLLPRMVPRFASSWPVDHSEFKRIGWCYGDAGVAAILLHASHSLQSKTLEDEALSLLHRVTILLAQPHCRDASFCHGMAGLAHIYNVAFQRTGHPQMRIEAERWIREILRRRRPGTGIAGYSFLTSDGDAIVWKPNATLLGGVVGVALVLLAAIESRVPEWQALFLL